MKSNISIIDIVHAKEQNQFYMYIIDKQFHTSQNNVWL